MIGRKVASTVENVGARISSGVIKDQSGENEGAKAKVGIQLRDEPRERSHQSFKNCSHSSQSPQKKKRVSAGLSIS